MITLRAVRLQLTAWYVGGFALVLALLFVGLFVVLSRDRSSELNASLELAATETLRAARIRQADGHAPAESLRLALQELGGPGRLLYLFDAQGRPLAAEDYAPEPEPPVEIRRVVTHALEQGSVLEETRATGGQAWRVYAQRFDESDGAAYVVAAVADAAVIERHEAHLIETFAALGGLALLPLAAGGYYLVKMSSAPATERLQRFTADAAHELRTPVTVLRASAEVALQRPRSPEEYEAALKDVAREADHLGVIIEDLFLLARADAGERPAAREPVYLDDLAADVVQSATPLAQTNGVQLSMGQFEETQVRGDPVLLRRLLMILLDNAIKFTPEGKAVRLDVHVVDGRPTVVVEDQGIGISPADVPRIFDRFFRADAARNRAEGSGLGLAIARYVADRHGARIRVDSQPGQGSRFAVVFPAAHPSSADLTNPTSL